MTSSVAVGIPGQPATEASLLAQARAGDRRARSALVAAHQDAVFGFLGRMLSPAGLAGLTEDLAQETFLRAFSALSSFDPDGPARLRTWILTIAARLAINECKRVRIATTPLEDFSEVLAGPFAADADDERRRAAHAIARAVSTLSPPHRAAFVLHAYHDLDNAEIAEVLDLPAGTVKSRLSRAREALRQALEEEFNG